jgi:hypothetical protein
MDYGKAESIRKKDLLSLISQLQFEQGKSFKGAVGSAISQKFSAKATGVKEALDPLNILSKVVGQGILGKGITTGIGRLFGRKDKDIERFGGYARKAKGIDKTTKIDKISGGEESSNKIVNSLNKLYEFMKKSDEDIKLKIEDKNNLAKEERDEDERRHKALVDAIKSYKKVSKPESKEDEEEKSPLKSLFDKIEEWGGKILRWGGELLIKLEKWAGEMFLKLGKLLMPILKFIGKIGLQVLEKLGALLMSPVGAFLLTAAAFATVAAWVASLIEKNPQAALRGEGPAGSAVVGPGGAQFESYDKEQADKLKEKQAKQVDKKGLKEATVEELQAKRDLMIDYGYAVTKKKEIEEIDKEIALRKSSTTPENPITPKASATAIPATPTSMPDVTATPASQATPTSTPDTTPASTPVSSPPASVPVSKTIPESVVSQQMPTTNDTPSNVVVNKINNIGNPKPKLVQTSTSKPRDDEISMHLNRIAVAV